MSARSKLMVSALLGTAIVIPILIGASCPTNSNTGIYNLVTGSSNLSVVPACATGYVCVEFTNSTTIPVKVALYRHNGFDPQNKCPERLAPSCCANFSGNQSCPCPCTGAETGDCKLSRDNLFTGCGIDPATAHLDTINGAQTTTLQSQASVEKRIRCGDAKSLGAAVSDEAADPITAPDDQNGPVYRDEAGGVRCGGTVQFLIVDLNQTTAGSGATDLVTLSIRANFSQ